MKKKKMLALLMSCIMTAGVLGGCGADNAKEGSSSAAASATTATIEGSSAEGTENSMFNEPGMLPIVKEPITLTVFAPANTEGSWEDNAQVKELEEATGIHLEWQTCASSDNVQEKLSTMFASGEMPDIILTGVSSGNRYDKATEQALGEQGLVLSLNDYLDTVSVGYKQAFEEIDGLKEYITTPDGNIYSLPNIDGSLHVQYKLIPSGWIIWDWICRPPQKSFMR